MLKSIIAISGAALVLAAGVTAGAAQTAGYDFTLQASNRTPYSGTIFLSNNRTINFGMGTYVGGVHLSPREFPRGGSAVIRLKNGPNQSYASYCQYKFVLEASNPIVLVGSSKDVRCTFSWRKDGFVIASYAEIKMKNN